MKKPVIGVTPQWDEEWNVLRMQPGYLEGVVNAGGLPLVLPLTSDENLIREVCGAVDGLLFTGGPDVHPEYYGEEALEYCELCKIRDDFETRLFSIGVIEMRKPSFGICRGLQIVNIMMGGTLYQDIAAQYEKQPQKKHDQDAPHDIHKHTVTITRGSPLHDLLDEEVIGVNSSHHQAIRDLAPGLEIMAISEDGLIESLFMPGGQFLWAVQWHPERTLKDGNSQKLFDAFVGGVSRGPSP